MFRSIKTSIIAVSVVLLVELATYCYLVNFRQNNKTNSLSVTKNVYQLPIPTSVIKPGVIAKANFESVFSWIDSQKSPKGLYYWEEIERSNNTKDDKIESTWSTLPILLARYYYWQETGGDEQLKAIETDLDTLGNFELVPLLQNNVWNCKTMYLLSADPKIPQRIKDKATKVCIQGLTYVKEISSKASLERYDETYLFKPKESYTDAFMKTAAPTGIKQDEMEIAEQNFGILASHVSDLVARYQWYNEDKYLNYAKGTFGVAVNQFFSLRSNEYVGGACTLAVGAVDLYNTTKDENYLSFYKTLINDQKVTGCGSSNNKCRRSLYDKAMCGIALGEGNKIIKGNSEAINKIKDNILTENYDAVGFPGYYQGRGVFYRKFIIGGEKADYFYNLRDNALAVTLLLHF